MSSYPDDVIRTLDSQDPNGWRKLSTEHVGSYVYLCTDCAGTERLVRQVGPFFLAFLGKSRATQRLD